MERVFHIFDKDDNGSISLQEFIDAMHQFAGQSPDDKIKFLFKVYDIDGKSEKRRRGGGRSKCRRSSGLIYRRRRNTNQTLQAGQAVKLCLGHTGMDEVTVLWVAGPLCH